MFDGFWPKLDSWLYPTGGRLPVGAELPVVVVVDGRVEVVEVDVTTVEDEDEDDPGMHYTRHQSTSSHENAATYLRVVLVRVHASAAGRACGGARVALTAACIAAVGQRERQNQSGTYTVPTRRPGPSLGWPRVQERPQQVARAW
jgi:hypothetical protein